MHHAAVAPPAGATRIKDIVKHALLIAVWSFWIPDAAAAQRTSAELAADSLFARSDWNASAAAYRRLVASDTSSGQNWVNLGESELQRRNYDDAIAAFAKAVALRFRPFRSMADEARANAAKGNDVRAYELLQAIIDGGAGGALRPYITGAPEFTRLASTPRFAELRAKMQPCTSAPFRQFDFWIGEWEVRGQGGGVLGRNSVTLEQSGCLVVENWAAANGNQTGSSFNYYDVRDRKWHQLYIDNSGNAGAFPPIAGNLAEGKMVMLSEDVNNSLMRWTWYPMDGGKVKQMAERSTDHGKTWTTMWNADYVKIK